MKIDNTACSLYWKCPKAYFERYEADQKDVQRPQDRTGLQGLHEGEARGLAQVPQLAIWNTSNAPRGIELDQASESRDFGTRLHQLLHERRQKGLGLPVPAVGEWPDEAIEAEAQATLAAYEAHYVRDYVYLESERTHCLPLERACPQCGHPSKPPSQLRSIKIADDQRFCGECCNIYTIHQLCVKLDAVVRHDDGTIGPFDTKTESRPGYNTREDWAGRTQAKIYLYALGLLYPHESVSRLVVDVVTRGSPKARRGPIFSRLDDIRSTPEAIQEALRNVSCTADDIERARRLGWWRSNMNICKKGWDRCDFYDLHVLGRTPENLRKYRPAEDYLNDPT